MLLRDSSARTLRAAAIATGDAAAAEAAGADAIADRVKARGGASRLSLLLIALVFALAVSGCGSKKSAPQAVFAVQASDSSTTSDELKSGADSLAERLALIGVPREQVHVQHRGTRFTVEVQRDVVSARSARLATKHSALEVYDLENDLAAASKAARGGPKPATSLYSLLAPQQQQVELKGADQWELFDASTKRLVAGPAATQETLFKTRVAKAHNIKPGRPPYVVFGIPTKAAVVSCGPRAVLCPGVALSMKTTWYLFTYRPTDATHPVPELTSSDVTRAQAEVDAAHSPVVLVDFDREGNRKLRELTRALYQRGQLLQRPQHLAVVVDREIRSMPQIDFTDDALANGINRGPLAATLVSTNQAKRIALALEPLPVRFTRIR
jgi:hypothetical protein